MKKLAQFNKFLSDELKVRCTVKTLERGWFNCGKELQNRFVGNGKFYRKEVRAMSIVNPWVYTRTAFDIETFKKATRNQYQFVGQKPYQSKKHPEDKGTTATLLIMYDDKDYGVDKNGNKRDNNVLNTFEVTILNGETALPFKKGETVSLGNLIPEKTFVIGFDLLLRFDSIRKAGV